MYCTLLSELQLNDNNDDDFLTGFIYGEKLLPSWCI